MFRYAGTNTTTSGDSLVGWQVECVQLSDGETVVPIFSDESSTPIASVSGVTNRAVTDARGNFEFYVENGTYSLRFYDAAGVFQRLDRFFTMYGAPDPIPVNAQTGTTYTLVLTDAFGAVSLNNASAITLTVPPESDAAFEVGTFIELYQLGAGAVTITPGSGVTINSRNALLDTGGQYAVAGLRKIAANTWLAVGDLG